MPKKRDSSFKAPPGVKNSKDGGDSRVRSQIMEAFADSTAEEGKPPRFVARFCKEIGITEAVFYNYFPSLHAVEKALWRHWISKIITAIEEGGDWKEFSARERYLSFLFALTQSATERRSLMLELLSDISPFSHPRALEGMREDFLEFAGRLIDHGIKSGEIADRLGLENFYPGILYGHMRWVIDQYLNDESDNFERTDVFIEKSVTLAFDLFRSQALDSAADLLRFLLHGNPWCSKSVKGN